MGDRGIAPIFYLFVAFSVGQSCQTCLEDCTIFCLHKICIAVASPHNDAFAAVVVPRNSAARFVKIGEVFLGAAITTTAIARWTVASAIFSHGWDKDAGQYYYFVWYHFKFIAAIKINQILILANIMNIKRSRKL